MAEVQPFAAIRYEFARLGRDLSDVLAPPYDVLDQADKDALLSRSERNIVAVDLPHIPPKSAGPQTAYAQAAETLARWLEDGTLIRESQPALYVYHQVFQHQGTTHTRRMLIARVLLQPFSDGVILPHEKTFGGPKEDRLALMKATRCQLSPIFGLYTDPQQAVAGMIERFTSGAPTARGALDGVENRVWIVTDAETISAVSAAFAEKRIYIADGHHRYGTALMYRDFLAEREGGALPENHPARFVMFVLANMEDPGCLILPYHRALSGIGAAELLDAWKEGVEPASEGADLVIVDGATGAERPVRFARREVLRRLEPEQVEPWYELDYAYLHRYLIDELLGDRVGESAGSSRVKVHYVKSEEAARRMARETAGAALLMKATPMAHLRAVSEAGGLMPQKSTYFYPKLATGVTLYPLA
ncbi:MAG: DUF1015 domain-containing protein [Planctomycetota bacterium]|nr:MAG: DUF1015 domain-containing protein [Planctomycetota bacterium]